MTKLTEWRSYEEVATFLLTQMATNFGLRNVEGKQIVRGQFSDTEWEIDARGLREGDGATVLIECRRHESHRLNQEAMAAIAYRIQDTNAVGAIVVSPLPLQVGAAKVAAANSIVHVRLDAHSTNTEYIMRFLSRIFVGGQPEGFTLGVSILGVSLEAVAPGDGSE